MLRREKKAIADKPACRARQTGE